MSTDNRLQTLVVPVNSAAYWAHLYEGDEDDERRIIDLTSTSTPLEVRDPVEAST